MSIIRGTIPGIGPVREKQLAERGVITIEQLAALDPKTIFWFQGIDRFVCAAKAHLAAKVKIQETTAAQVPMVTLGPVGPVVHQGPTGPEKTVIAAFKFGESTRPESTSLDSTRLESAVQQVSHLIEDHSWFEQQVMVPMPSNESAHVLQTAVVYELNIDPANRVSMLCQVVVYDADAEDKERVVSHSFSPQLVFHFNTSLPDLQVNISQADYDSVPNRFAIANAIEEVNIMRQMIVKPVL